MNSYLLVLDLEFSGPNLLKHGIVSVGVALTWYNNTQYKFVKEFYRECNLTETQTFDTATVESFWKSSESLNTLYTKVIRGECTPPKSAIEELVAFMRECYKLTDGNVVVCSNRADIDCSWLNLYLCRYDFPPLHFLFDESGKTLVKIVDTNSYHQALARDTHVDVLNFDGRQYSPNESAFRQLGISDRPITVYNHCAINDAKWLAEAHILILQALARTKPQPHTMMPTGFNVLPQRRSMTSGVYIAPQFGTHPSSSRFYPNPHNVAFIVDYPSNPTLSSPTFSRMPAKRQTKRTSDDFRLDHDDFPRLDRSRPPPQ